MDARASRSSSAQPMARVAGVTRDSSIQRTRESSVNPAGSTTPAPNVPSAFTSNHRTSVSSCISQSTVQRRAPKRIHSQASSVLVSITSASGDALHEPNLLIPDALDNDLQNMAHPGLDPVSPRVISKAIFDLGSASEMDSPRNMSTVDLDKSPFAASSFNSESVSLMKRPSSWAPAPHDIPAGLAPAPPHLAHSKSLASQISSYSQQSKAGTAETSRGKHSRSTTPGTASTANTGTTKETVREHQKAADAKNNHVYSNATLGSSSTYKCDEGGWEGFGQAACTKALKERLDRITLWTKQTPLPSIYTTMKEWRFIFRVAQVALTCASFTGLAVGTFRANYMSSVLSTAGINYMAFTAIASMVWLFLKG
ncbi:hypothetical protein BC830DRAFT_1136574 [Chytriomyces sp. MP71]|nr:hypothetical protein BC830DRAFT_1136574 [Chytriomyces sp. MP71]